MLEKFPTRTVVLMVLTLISFVWFWIQTHQRRATTAAAPTSIKLLGPGDAR